MFFGNSAWEISTELSYRSDRGDAFDEHSQGLSADGYRIERPILCAWICLFYSNPVCSHHGTA